MKKTATILALAGLSMASNPEHIHGSFRTRKIVDHKPLIDSSVSFKPMMADDEFQIIRDGGSSYNGDPRFNPKSTTKPSTWTPPTNPKVWTQPKQDVRLYADDADDELQIIRMDGGNSYNGDPRFNPKSTTKPSTWTPPSNPKVWIPQREDVRLYADDADDELQIMRIDDGPRIYNGDPRFNPKSTTKPSTWTPPTNPKIWIPQREDVRLYADDADDELQIIRDGGSGYNGDPRFNPKSTTKPSTWTPPTNPKVWIPKREDVRLYADDADDELQIVRMDRPSYNGDPRFAPKSNTKKPSTWTPPINPKYGVPKREDFRLYADGADDELQIIRMDGPSYNGDPRFNPKSTTKPSTWTPPTNPKVWIPQREDVRLYADDADDELQIIRMDGPSYNGDPRFNPKTTTKPSTWTPPTNPKVWIPKREDVRLYADDADDELIALGELLNL